MEERKRYYNGPTDPNDEYYTLKRQHDENKKRNDAKYKDYSKKRLTDTIHTRMKTTMIGTLAIIEKTIGHLWGLTKDRPLTPDEEEMLDMWEDMRAQILDLGNNNIRIVEDELSRYTINWNRYNYSLEDLGSIVRRPSHNKKEN